MRSSCRSGRSDTRNFAFITLERRMFCWNHRGAPSFVCALDYPKPLRTFRSDAVATMMRPVLNVFAQAHRLVEKCLVLAGRHAEPRLEGARQMRLVGEAALDGDMAGTTPRPQ